ncbi:hypothetical protein BGZ94_002726 [Podila epigama]|nr:hypothetical protein BGZ94_002726 [Podila epigama]
MDKHHAKKVIDTLYDWLFDGHPYVAPSAGGQCVKAYVDGDEVASGSFANKVKSSIGYVKDRYGRAAQDHAVAVASGAASAVSIIVAKHGHHHIGAATTGIPGQGHVAPPTATFFDKSFTARIGAGHSIEEPHGPSHHKHQKTDPTLTSNKNHAQGSSSSSATSHGGAGSSSTSSNNAGGAKGAKGKGKKGSGAQDHGGVSSNHTLALKGSQLGKNNGMSSWAALLGSAGFRGAENVNFMPIDIVAAMKATGSDHHKVVDAPTLHRHRASIQGEGIGSMILEGPTEAQHNQDEIALDNQKGYLDSTPESEQELALTTALPEKSHTPHKDSNTDNSKTFVHSQANIGSKHNGPAGPGSETHLRTRVPRPHTFKVGDRHRHRPHIYSSSSSSSSSSSRQKLDGFGNPQPVKANESVATKIIDRAQSSTFFKNLDGISGGVLGAALVTAATLVNTAEAAADSVKHNMPKSLTDFATSLQESFDESMHFGGLEGSGFDEEPRTSHVQITELDDEEHSSSSKSHSSSSTVQSKGGPISTSRPTTGSSKQAPKAWPSSYGPMANKDNSEKIGSTIESHTMVANPPRMRQRSVDHTSISSSSRPHAVSRDPSIEDISVGPVIHHKTHTETTPAPVSNNTTNVKSMRGVHSSNSTRDATVRDRTPSIEDISIGPKTPHAVYAEYVGKSSTEHDGSSTSQEESESDDNFVTAKILDPPTKMAHKAKVASKQAEKKAVLKSFASGAAFGTGNKIATAVEKAASDAKKAKDDIAHDIEAKVHDIETSAKNMAKKAQNSLNSSLASAQKAKDAVVKSTHDSVLQAERAVENAVENAAEQGQAALDAAVQRAKNVANAAIDSAVKAKGAIVATVENAAEQAETAVEGAASAAKGIVDAGIASVQSTKDAITHGAQELAKDAEHVVESGVEQVKDVATAMTETAMQAKDAAAKAAKQAKNAAVHEATAMERQAERAAQSGVKNAKKFANVAARTAQEAKDTAILDALVIENRIERGVQSGVKQAKDIANAAAQTAKQVKDDAVHDAKVIEREAEQIAKSGVKKAKDVANAAANAAKQVKDAAVHDAKVIEREVEKLADSSVKNAKMLADAAAHTAQEAKDTAILDALVIENRIERGVQSGVKQAKDIANAAAQTAKQATDVAVHEVQEVERQAEDIVESGINAVKAAVNAAANAAKQVKDAAVHDAQVIERKVEDIAENGMKKAKNVANAAANTAKQVRDAAVHDVQVIERGVEGIAESGVNTVKAAVNAAVNAATHAAKQVKDTAVHDAQVIEREVEDIADSGVKNAKAVANAAVNAAKQIKDAAVHDAQIIEREVEDIAENGMKKAKDVANAALSTAQKAKDTVGNSASEVAHKTEAALEDASVAAAKAVGTAVLAAESSAEAMAKTAAGALQKTADAVKGAAASTLTTARHDIEEAELMAKEVADATLAAAGTVKDGAVHATTEAAKNAESAIENALKQGLYNTEAFWTGTHVGQKIAPKAIGTPKDLNVRVNNHGSKAVDNDVQAAIKAAKDFARKTEVHAPQHLHSATHKAPVTAHKTSDNAKAVLDSALAAAHKAEAHVTEQMKAAAGGHIPGITRPVHLDVFGAPSSSFTFNAPLDKKEKHQPTVKGMEGKSTFFKNDKHLDSESKNGSGGKNEEDDNHKPSGSGGRVAAHGRPSILNSTKAAASAAVARVADASQQKLQNARQQLSQMVDHVADNLAGQDDDGYAVDSDNSGSDGEDHDIMAHSKKQGAFGSKHHPQQHPHHHQQNKGQNHHHQQTTVDQAAESIADIADSVSEMIHGARDSVAKAAKDVKALASDTAKNITHHESAIHPNPDSTGIHTYKPNLHSTHLDKDGFTIVEAPEEAHEYEIEHQVEPADNHGSHSAIPGTFASSHGQSHHQVQASDAHATAKKHSTARKGHSQRPRGLSYSDAVQLNKDEDDHGPLPGITESRGNNVFSGTKSDRSNDSFFQNENYGEFADANGGLTLSVISHGGDQIKPTNMTMQSKHQQYEQQTKVHPHEGYSPRRISTSHPTTNVSMEHGHGQLQGVEHFPKTQQQQYTVDAQGNKVPVSSERRDSGYDLLL